MRGHTLQWFFTMVNRYGKYLNYITLIINYESKAHLYKISVNKWVTFFERFFFLANLLYKFFVWFQKQKLETAAEDNNKATLAMQGKQNKTHQTHLNAIPLSIWAFIYLHPCHLNLRQREQLCNVVFACSWDKPAIPSRAIIHNGTLLLAQ